jgi:hypothetical protein
MPSYIDNNTQIPAARVKMNDDATGFVNRPWYRWFFNMYQAVEAGRRYGSFYSTQTQTAASANTPYAMTFNTTTTNAQGTDLTYGVYTSLPNSRVYVDITSTYNIQFSAQFYSANSSAKIVRIWIAVNGTAVPDTATKVTVKDGAYVAAWNFLLNLTAGDYFELYWDTESTAVSILAEAAAAPVPAIPSVILTVTSCVGV